MTNTPRPASPIAIWALGATQVIGYGTLFYSFAILAPDMARDLGISAQWAFGALSVGLFVGSLFAPAAGRLADRHGAGRMLSIGSVFAALALVGCSLAPDRYGFAIGLLAMELASCMVLYATAFVAIVQIGRVQAQRSITALTLIAGFASTVFWPLTSLLHETLDWRSIYQVFAVMHLVACLPIHLWIARLSTRVSAGSGMPNAPEGPDQPAVREDRIRPVFLAMFAGFVVSGLVLFAALFHMVPLLTTLGLGTAGIAVSTLFGPAQVASRLVNMVFGGRLPQTWLATIAVLCLALGLAVLMLTRPGIVGIGAFVILFGFGSGLLSIVVGTLPLEVFGRQAYGRSVGWMSSARQLSAAVAPFLFALMLAQTSVDAALGALLATAVAGFAAFLWVALATRPR